ncbi:MAG: tRNA 5-methoxyuridine(34)/uridine 5-oxyacetic acid(34) synthase CmoB [Proteobacteria bacterium]|nr:tRNA 5-methoxyuridine(34)/uridine 5-oxyacetic acid(34) synthase CmoB [Pseudomonadota bacterium]
MARLSSLVSSLERAGLKGAHTQLLQLAQHRYAHPRHRHFDEWQHHVDSLPEVAPSFIDLDRAAPVIGREADCTGEQHALLKQSLQALCPWRKGPFSVFGIDIDAEWRSDWKWARIAPHLGSLQNCSVLDVGCGNGYYALRMQGLGARLVLGLEPMWVHVFQWSVLHRYLPQPQRIFVLPLRLEELPQALSGFDLAFSMGVLYHSRQPREHLSHVFKVLKAGGRILLETLIIEDRAAEALVPVERYAGMRNVWVIPSYTLLKAWLVEAGFDQVRLLDQSQTTTQEQRPTNWMTGHSLVHALNPNDTGQTIEGYPAPLRACIVAEKPA